jgi:transposase
MLTTTRCPESSVRPVTLFVAFELGSTRWKLTFAVGLGHRPRVVQIPARDLRRVWLEIARAKTRFQLPAETAVRSCYEAGRDGFWLHRALSTHGVTNVVVDPSSIAVDRRARRVKTDRVDAVALVTQLMHATAGDRGGWREVRVPSVAAEADRQLHRERETVRDAHRTVWNRIQGLLMAQGVGVPRGRQDVGVLQTVRLWDGSPLPDALRERLEREWTQLQALAERLRTVDRLRHARVTNHTDAVARQTRRLTQLRGVGEIGAMTLSTELFAWRGFTNGRQVGAIVGLTPTPYQSDQRAREQGISRSGNRRVRVLSVELAWSWVRWQPLSALTRWFQDRFGQHGRARKIGIVALARKLVIALWRWVDQGILPVGAVLKA